MSTVAKLITTAIIFVAIIFVASGVSTAAYAGLPLKCVDVRCRQAPTTARKSGSIIISDCVRKHGKAACAASKTTH